jgi:hypothetical protein
MAFSAGQNVQAGDLNNFSVTTVTTSGAMTAGGPLAANSTLAVTGAATLASTISATNLADEMGGRLTLTSATPVTSADVTGAGTLYYAPYRSNVVSLYTGSLWLGMPISELSIAVPAVANQVYDAFIDYNAGTPALTLTAWANDITRGTALAYQNGRLVLSGTATKRYVGSVRTVTASQLNDSVLLRHVSNYYNRIPRTLVATDANGSWTYTTATVRQARGSAANQVDVLVGVAEVPLDLILKVGGVNDAANSFAIGVGEDSTTTFADGVWHRTSGVATMVARLVKYPAIGRHVYSWNEWSEAAGTTTFYGTNTNGSATTSGLRGFILG